MCVCVCLCTLVLRFCWLNQSTDQRSEDLLGSVKKVTRRNANRTGESVLHLKKKKKALYFRIEWHLIIVPFNWFTVKLHYYKIRLNWRKMKWLLYNLDSFQWSWNLQNNKLGKSKYFVREHKERYKRNQMPYLVTKCQYLQNLIIYISAYFNSFFVYLLHILAFHSRSFVLI